MKSQTRLVSTDCSTGDRADLLNCLQKHLNNSVVGTTFILYEQ